MPAVVQRVRRFIRQHDLMRPDTRVVCALSGGSDSVALASLVAELDTAGDLRFVALAHLNHRLRPTADRDERCCRELADRLRKPILVESADVAARAAREGRSLEVAAHEERYALYVRARAHFAADVVALGHTRDDQAETVLLRLMRGAGPRGLGGMHPRHGDVVRPLLDCSRADLREWLALRQAQGERLTFVEDETNADLTIPRNRVRADLLPRLAAEFNPNIVETLAREADLARDIWSWLESELVAFDRGTANPGPETRGLDVMGLRAVPRGLQRLALWRALSDSADRPIASAHVDAALGLLDARDGASVDAPGVRVHRIGERIVLTRREGSTGSSPNPVNYWRFPLSIPGEVTADGMRLSAELVRDGTAGMDRSANVGRGLSAAVRADLVRQGPGDGLAVRNRRPGDRFRPVGLGGRKKLQDFFVDRKIARADRDSVPIVVDDRDRIVWVAGHGIDEAFRVTDASQAVVVLKLSYLERCS